MLLQDGRISILFSKDGLHIEIYDDIAAIRFVDIHLTPEQTCQAFSRIAYTPCTIQVKELHKVGKKHEHNILTFPLSTKEYNREKNTEKAIEIADIYCPEGWIPDKGYNSKDSFSIDKMGFVWAKTFIRRWVDIEKV